MRLNGVNSSAMKPDSRQTDIFGVLSALFLVRFFRNWRRDDDPHDEWSGVGLPLL